MPNEKRTVHVLNKNVNTISNIFKYLFYLFLSYKLIILGKNIIVLYYTLKMIHAISLNHINTSHMNDF